MIIPDLTLIGPWDGDTWTVAIGDYNSDNPYDICTQLRFDTKEEAEAYIAEAKVNPPSTSICDADALCPFDDDDEPCPFDDDDKLHPF